MLSFKALSEKKTKIKINPKMNDVMEGGFRATAESGMPITMHSYEKGGKVKKAKKVVSEKNHGEDCDCMKCESKRRRDDVNDGPDVQTEAKVDKGRSDYGKASIRNYRRMGPGHDDPGMFDPEGKRGKTIDKRREEHKARRGVKGAKVPAYKVEEANPYGKRAKLKMLIKGFAEKNRMKSKNIAKEGMYDVDPKTGESPVATSVRKGNKLKGDKRLKHFAKLSKKMIGEEGYDRMRDAALEKGTWKGGGGQPSIARQSRMKGQTPLQKEAEKKYGKGATALDIVKKEIIKKHGKGAIMDVKKK